MSLQECWPSLPPCHQEETRIEKRRERSDSMTEIDGPPNGIDFCGVFFVCRLSRFVPKAPLCAICVVKQMLCWMCRMCQICLATTFVPFPTNYDHNDMSYDANRCRNNRDQSIFERGTFLRRWHFFAPCLCCLCCVCRFARMCRFAPM